MAGKKGERRGEHGLDKEKERRQQEAHADKANMRESAEDKGQAARRTTPAGKGRSQ